VGLFLRLSAAAQQRAGSMRDSAKCGNIRALSRTNAEMTTCCPFPAKDKTALNRQELRPNLSDLTV
jgi:hypothetical protein